jgi:serine/threonine protein kinase
MAASLEVGSTFAGHRIERLLGVGGMGEVYLATRLDGERAVALKVVSPRVAGDVRFRRRFERESRLARGLRHGHIVGVHQAGESEGRLYMSMAYVDGVDLSAVLAERGWLHPAHAAVIVTQVAGALDAAADAGLVHRDVKPGNILLEARGDGPHAYLGDFGLSKHVSSTSGVTRTGHWVGTIDYASPEQLQAAEVDRATDVYALGGVLHKMLTGEVPYPRDRDLDKMVAHLSEPPPRPSATTGEIPGRFDEVVARAMAKRPEDRYASAAALAADALAAAGEAGPPSPWTASQRPSPGPAADPDAPTAA